MDQTPPATTTQSMDKKWQTLWIIVGILLVVQLGVLSYFLFYKPSKSAPNITQNPTPFPSLMQASLPTVPEPLRNYTSRQYLDVIPVSKNLSIRFDTSFLVSLTDLHAFPGFSDLNPQTGKQVLAVQYDLANTTAATLSANIPLGRTTMRIVDNTGKDIDVKESDISNKSFATTTSIPANLFSNGTLFFEIPTTYKETKSLFLVIESPAVPERKIYIPL